MNQIDSLPTPPIHAAYELAESRLPMIVGRATELMKPLMDRLGEIPAEQVGACRDAMVQACVRISIQLEDEAKRQLGIDS